jgi:hypothetical protein
MRSATGTLGKHRFATASEVNTFNSRVTDWFSMRGFARDTSTTFQEITKSSDWKMPGVLLSKSHGSAGQFHVFVPEHYNPNSHLQIVSYHVELRGTIEEVDRLAREFDRIEAEYHGEFGKDGETEAPLLDGDTNRH